MKRLTELSGLPLNVSLPQYDPEEHQVGIVHLGIGAFHRGHMAVYTDAVMASDGGDWRITGVSLRSAGVRDRLEPQNGLYTLVERSAAGEKLRIVGSLKDVLVAPEDPAAVLDCLTRPATRIVSLTITEKGYLRDPASGALMADHADIRHDLENPAAPKTMHGFLTEAFARIRQAGTTPFTPLCCDNLPSNGDSLKRVVLEFAAMREAELAAWIAEHIVFPNTMVDRIVPATTAEDIEAVSKQLGCLDEAPVLCEPFSQWVIADSLPQPRPAWEKFGVTFVKEVEPFEEMKLRLLNASHSAMAYLGYLGGYDYIHQVISDANYRTFISTMMAEEIVPTLHMPEGIDLSAYCATLIERFGNPTLWHRTWQIAMDGSLKVPPRLLSTISDRIARGEDYRRLALSVAAWLRYITGIDEKGQAIDVSDPFAARLRSIADSHKGNIPAYVKAMMQVQEVFGSELPQNQEFVAAVTQALTKLYEQGAKATLSEF